MQLFLSKHIPQNSDHFTLDEPTSKHLIQVLRMKVGATLALTDGAGTYIEATIIDDNRKRAQVSIQQKTFLKPRNIHLSIAVCFTKNKSRNEWMLEKLTELGVDYIIPIIASRSEKEKWNSERFQSILESAMLQSKQVYIPQLSEPIRLENYIKKLPSDYQLMVAHCENDYDKNSIIHQLQPQLHTCIFIGPEGDFTQDEINLIKNYRGQAITLGMNRLRTETAAIYATTIFNALNYE